jgi:hypothetical protein
VDIVIWGFSRLGGVIKGMSQVGVSRHGLMFGNTACRINYISELVSEISIRTLNPQRKAVVFLPPPLTTDR